MRATLPSLPTALDVDLTGLCEAAEPWISGLPVSDQRVQAAPDARTVRYYQTIGLLDRPVRYDGRTARYGHRHLLQLVAIRTLQSNGLSLSQVQALLTGSTNQELQQIVDSAMGESAHEVADSVQPSDLPPVAPDLSFDARITSNVFVALELAPGVVVTIDSRIHPDTARTISVLRRALAGASEASTDAPQGDLS